MSQHAQIVAVGLLTEAELKLLGDGFKRFYPVDGTHCFGELLRAIDDADRQFRAEAKRGQR